ncbi:LOW QUALITY PROTEIN: nucleobase-ascorbate transporter 4 [Populus trichocarpa]|uniref:LOW QUALITY PROTEIN: nucleobase-ascorbate transporter 4 n=1 Tax=Populus trichocarpa TaxID=3694 RepID=UPI00227790A5|nr:LOW QUALITY PROTEIN: nucleobase-ascorbate transporter 4 [Populus trichocarpa]
MAVGGAAKVGVFAPFPVKDQLPGVDFCVSSSPSWPEAILLGFQHYLVMLGTTVIIPSIFVLLISRFNVEKAEMINTLLFVAGINSLLQTWFGTRLPVVIGGSYAFSIPTITISLSTNNSTNVIFLTPRQLAKCVEIGILALLFVVFISQFVPHMMKSRSTICSRFAVLFAIAVVWAYAAVLTVAGAYNNKHPDTQLSSRVDRAGLISAAPWIKVPYPFQWGRPTFDAGDVFAMMAACFVAIVESTGTIIEVSRYGSATPLPPSVLSRGIGWL